MASSLRSGLDHAIIVECRTTISGLQVPSVIDGDEVIGACRLTGGTGHIVEDSDVYAIQRRLAAEEGIYCEPAGAVAVMAALNAVARGEIARDDAVVCLVTGIAFKDPDSIVRMTSSLPCPTINWHQLEQRIAPQ
jgi:threonine synthase